MTIRKKNSELSVICLVLMLFLFHSLPVVGQIDREFWFVAPEASENHGEKPVYIRISTLDEAARFALRMPANNKFVPVESVIPPNSTFSIRLDEIAGDPSWLDSIENRPPDTKLRKGFLLTSDKYITAYYEINNASNPAIFPFKGKNALGTTFYIPGQTNFANQTNDGSEAFDIVATRDTTTITIIPSIDIVGHLANVPFQIVLHRGESYSARTLLTNAAASLAGSYVSSDKPIAITISDDSIITGGWDIIGDQIIPVNLLGFEYIAIKGFADNNPPNNNDERVYVLATQDGTQLNIDGNPVPAAVLNAGEQFNYGIPAGNNTALIRVDKPAYVYHLTGHAGEAGASILPHDSCTGSRKVGFNRSSSSAFAMLILTRSGNEGSFQLNGNNSLITAPDFSPVPGSNGNWVFFRQNNMTLTEVPVGGNLLENSNGKFHLGILNNVGASSEYGYFSDFSTLYLGADASMCPGDSIVLDGGPFRESYEWKRLVGGNWIAVGSNQTFTCYDSGYYACITNGDFCQLYDTIRVQYFPNASVSLGEDVSICEGTTVTLNPGNYLSYLWSDGSSGSKLVTGLEDSVWVEVLNTNGCFARDTVIISVDSLPFSDHPVIGPMTVCQGAASVNYSIAALKYANSYQWSVPPGCTGSSSANAISVTFSTSANPGNVTVHGINNCGAGNQVVLPVMVNPLPGDPGVITGPLSVCQGETGVVFSVLPIPHAENYTWELPNGFSINGTPSSTVNCNITSSAVSGDIRVTGVNTCGQGVTSTIPVNVNPLPPQPESITGQSVVCQGAIEVAYEIPLVPGADSYIWSTPPGSVITSGAGTASILITFDSTAISGMLTVYGHNNLCGDGPPRILPITLNPLPSPAGIINGKNPVCQGESSVSFSIPPSEHATNYSWSLPSGAMIVSGAGTPTIVASFPVPSVSGILSVQGNNNQCGFGRKSSILLTVNPLPVLTSAVSGPIQVCQSETSQYSFINNDPNTTNFQWVITPSSSGTLNGTGAQVSVAYSDIFTGATFLTVRGVNGCGSGPVTLPTEIKVNYRPQVTYRTCHDLQTTKNAREIKLTGGTPSGPGGSFSGTGVVQLPSGEWVFQPISGAVNGSSAGTIYTITYHYTNAFGCHNEASNNIKVYSSNSGQPCPGTMTDVRDGREYPTFMAGFGASARCWMASNLNYGDFVLSNQGQTENCVVEKYCLNDQQPQCNNSGGFYQWGELMRYQHDFSMQGICPAGWHVPSESEWQMLLTGVTAGISPPVDGIAGGFLKDTNMVSGFHAMLSGMNYLGSLWAHENSGTNVFGSFYWTSTTYNETHSWSRGLLSRNPSVSKYPGSKGNAFNVRCVRD